MKITQIDIQNFRLLSNANIRIEDDITLIVGKNNTGKTSLFEAINILVKQKQAVSFEDFSKRCYLTFSRCCSLYTTLLSESDDKRKEKIENIIKCYIPKIQLRIDLEYDILADSLIALSEFLVDLDEERHDASILINYEPFESLRLFNDYVKNREADEGLIVWLKNNIRNYYKLNTYAVDVKSDYKKIIDHGAIAKIEQVVMFEDIKASRNLDDTKADKNKTLALGFSHYYRERDKSREDIKALQDGLKTTASTLKVNYDHVIADIKTDLRKFGVESNINIPDINIESEFNADEVIRNNIKYYYNQDGVMLPESYNGLGYSNLIYMILEITSFIEKQNNPKTKLTEFITILIEEPEAHMHPQMQQVFISQIIKKIREKTGVKIQVIITTHSSHIVAEAGIDENKGFDRIRYFNKTSNIAQGDKVVISDFNKFRHSNTDKETYRFLKQYMHLSKCDIFFADKVIMIEGITEKLLIPVMINKVAPSLNNEYVSIIEVGGAYTYKFKEILEFIKVKTLIITDIDSVDPSDNNKECPVDFEGANTSNQTLIQWLPCKQTIADLISSTDNDKINGNFNNVRVAYQISEDESLYVARSLEESIINKNKEFFTKSFTVNDNNGPSLKQVKNSFSLFRTKSVSELNEQSPWNLRPKSSAVKTNFTFDLIMFNEEEAKLNWSVPKYIAEGLEWLATNKI